MNSENKVRLNKFISDKGICSRREADKLIEDGKVYVNGTSAVTGMKISLEDKISVNGKILSSVNKKVYIALNKPVGIVSTTEHKVKGNIIDFINYKERIFPIGRLDKPSEGLILLTNDGDIVNKILRAGNNHEKEYLVWTDKEITQDFLDKMGGGVNILGRKTKPCSIYKEDINQFRIILTEGLNRQIRRMCEKLGYQVKRLKRIRIMNIKLGNLKPGRWRYLTEKEFNILNSLIKDSIKTEEASK
ncbi:MAG: 23S rRNA pseudouridine(2604) synthase RluF [Bacillota bacterium]|nr:23S rRNA pseudouridine(2604) synthase RluF [Bacillota bacterium]